MMSHLVMAREVRRGQKRARLWSQSVVTSVAARERRQGRNIRAAPHCRPGGDRRPSNLGEGGCRGQERHLQDASPRSRCVRCGRSGRWAASTRTCLLSEGVGVVVSMLMFVCVANTVGLVSVLAGFVCRCTREHGTDQARLEGHTGQLDGGDGGSAEEGGEGEHRLLLQHPPPALLLGERDEGVHVGAVAAVEGVRPGAEQGGEGGEGGARDAGVEGVRGGGEEQVAEVLHTGGDLARRGPSHTPRPRGDGAGRGGHWVR